MTTLSITGSWMGMWMAWLCRASPPVVDRFRQTHDIRFRLPVLFHTILRDWLARLAAKQSYVSMHWDS